MYVTMVLNVTEASEAKKNVHFLFFLIDTNKFIYLDNVKMICHF